MTEGDAANESWVQLIDVADQAEAMVVTSLLRGAGIECRVVQETIGALMGLYSGKLGIMHIEVLASQRELAQQLLAAEPGPADPERPEPPEQKSEPEKPEA